MLNTDFEDRLEKLFEHGHQIWLLGAGASYGSNLPLMEGLTARVVTNLSKTPVPHHDELTIGTFIDSIRNQTSLGATIEDILDQISDYASMARRGAGEVLVPVAEGKSNVKTSLLRFDALMGVRAKILGEIREAIRWGYVHANNPSERRSGEPGTSIVEIAPHHQFVAALFGGLLAARERHLRPVEFFTTNYDTLIEDALALYGIPYIDGFRGGAVGFWDPTVYPDSTNASPDHRATVTKIHGSIDWALAENQRIVRRRIGDSYPCDGEGAEVLIYPQATKYEFVRREPFDSLFQRFRSVLNRNIPQVLFICGYGFGDEHVNRELEEALARRGNQLTAVALSKQRNDKLIQWGARSFGERMYVLTEQGAWRGDSGPHLDGNHDWWTFEGVTNLLRRGGRIG